MDRNQEKWFLILLQVLLGLATFSLLIPSVNGLPQDTKRLPIPTPIGKMIMSLIKSLLPYYKNDDAWKYKKSLYLSPRINSKKEPKMLL